MPRAMWSGAISFGLVTVPVKLYPATRTHDISFHQIHRDTQARVKRKRVDAETGEEVPYDEIVKGYDLGGGRYVIIDPDELEALDPKASREIAIEDFVELADIDPLYYSRSYYLAPANDTARKPFVLLRDAMEQAGRAAIARFVMRSKEYLVALRPHEGLLVATTLNYADEVVSSDAVEGPELEDVELSDRERDMAAQLLASLENGWDPERYTDTYQRRVQELIEAKAAGEEIAIPEEGPEAADVVDLMEALERSLKAGKAAAAGSAATDDDLASLSKAELYERAQELDIPGRSDMTKDQLIAALTTATAA